jgi:hypothetical protein
MLATAEVGRGGDSVGEVGVGALVAEGGLGILAVVATLAEMGISVVCSDVLLEILVLGDRLALFLR